MIVTVNGGGGGGGGAGQLINPTPVQYDPARGNWIILPFNWFSWSRPFEKTNRSCHFSLLVLLENAKKKEDTERENEKATNRALVFVP
jgi:hypothetical protein